MTDRIFTRTPISNERTAVISGIPPIGQFDTLRAHNQAQSTRLLSQYNEIKTLEADNIQLKAELAAALNELRELRILNNETDFT